MGLDQATELCHQRYAHMPIPDIPVGAQLAPIREAVRILKVCVWGRGGMQGGGAQSLGHVTSPYTPVL